MNHFLRYAKMSLFQASVIALASAALVVTFLPGASEASFRIGSNVTMWPSAQAVPGKEVFQRCITAGDSEWAYFIYLPAAYDSTAAKTWPLLIFQEVAGAMYDGNGGNISSMFDSARGGMNGGPVYDLMNTTKKPAYLADRFILLAPFVKSDMVLYARGGAPGRMMGLYKDIIRRFKVDTTHISMMGDCAGGGLVWGFCAAYPKFPSAMVCMSCNDNWCSTVDLTKACNLKDIPYEHYADQSDPMVPYAAQTAIRDAITACGGTKMQFFTSNIGQHEIWGLAGLDTVKTMYDWMLNQQIATPVVPTVGDHQKSGVSMNKWSASDRIEVVGLNGQILLKTQGDVSKMGRSLPSVSHGVQIIRVTRAAGSRQQTILSRP